MQTHFTPEQLRDPGMARANEILRACVHCGFCTATCPTYAVLGDELDSPRGRIYLIKEMLETGRDPDPLTVKHLDRCLGCLSCMTTCPSGVHYAHLIEEARLYIEARYRRPLMDRLLRAVLGWILPYPGRFRLALMAAKIGRPLRGLLPDPRLRAMLELAPKKIHGPSRADDPQNYPATVAPRKRVALLTGCAQKALNPAINAATLRLLRRHGCEVVIPQGMGCCGALNLHMGKEAQAKALAEANIRAVMAEYRAGGLDAVVINTSGCGTTIKDYGHLFAGTALAEDAAQVVHLARDVTEIMAELGLEGVSAPVMAGRGLQVAYHAACSLQHGQQIKSTPKDLLQSAGFRVMEPKDSHLCCGSAGTYNLLQPQIAGALKARKVEALSALKPDLIAAGNIGCMMQIGSAAGVPVVHTVELLDWATGGPKPEALAALA